MNNFLNPKRNEKKTHYIVIKIAAIIPVVIHYYSAYNYSIIGL